MNASTVVAHVRSGPSPLVVHLLRGIEERKRMEGLTKEILVRIGELTGREADEVLHNQRPRNPTVELTSRETAVLKALGQGKSTSEIASELNISTATVRNHVQRLLGKLQCHTRLEAVMRAEREGLI